MNIIIGQIFRIILRDFFIFSNYAKHKFNLNCRHENVKYFETAINSLIIKKIAIIVSLHLDKPL